MTIEIINTDRLDDFWELLSPIGKFIQKFERPIFRGQGLSDWHLTPKALRKNEIIKYKSEALRGTSATEHVIFFEYFLLHNFLNYCDNSGLLIPQDSRKFREKMDFYNFTNNHGIDANNWPEKDFYPFVALAQHHGIPTRLLDWTRNSLVAAYFAATQAIAENKIEKTLAVYIIDSATISRTDPSLEVVFLPGSTSPYLAAQHGCFTIHRQPEIMNSNTIISLDKLEGAIENALKEHESITAYKIILQNNLAGKLLMRCNKFGISANTLFPGFDGAAKATLEFQRAKLNAGLL